MDKNITISIALALVALCVIIGSIQACSNFQYAKCMDARIEAIKAHSDVLAASIRCSSDGSQSR